MTSRSNRKHKAATQAVHAGEEQNPSRSGAMTPIYQTAPFRFGSVAELEGAFSSASLEWVYTRYGNPTVQVVEEKLAALEEAESAVACSSGMAAISATLSTFLRSGDRIVVPLDLYGGTTNWLNWLGQRQPEVLVERVPTDQLVDAVEASAEPPTVVLAESPSNPLLKVCDLASLANACRKHETLLVVDNTFATPVLQRPLTLGAHLVVHSATKFLGGHSDLTAGFVAGEEKLVQAVRSTVRTVGCHLEPLTAFLLARGMRTLPLRLAQQCTNAERLADFLASHHAVATVYFPGGNPIAQRQMDRPGALVAFDLRGDLDGLRRTLDRLQVVSILPSLGGLETNAIPPAVTSHRQLNAEERAAIGLGETVVRVCCGIEDPEDLIADFRQALDS